MTPHTAPGARVLIDGPLRRAPVRDRSVARVHLMLDACADLIDEVGYDGLSTTLIAQRAKASVGSVYRFFPDKLAITQAMTLRNLERYLDWLCSRLAKGDLPHWWDGLEAGIGRYIVMHRTTPGFRTLHLGDVTDTHMRGDNTSVLANQLSRILVERYDIGDSVRYPLQLALEAADALINLAFCRKPNGDTQVLTEARMLMWVYLRRRTGGSPQGWLAEFSTDGTVIAAASGPAQATPRRAIAVGAAFPSPVDSTDTSRPSRED